MNTENIRLASKKLQAMLRAKQEEEGLTQRQLAKAIQFYCPEGMIMSEANIGSYTRDRKDTGYPFFPTTERLTAIGLYFGYEIDEFLDLLFDNPSQPTAHRNDISNLWQLVHRLKKPDKIHLHRFLTEELYREVSV